MISWDGRLLIERLEIHTAAPLPREEAERLTRSFLEELVTQLCLAQSERLKAALRSGTITRIEVETLRLDLADLRAVAQRSTAIERVCHHLLRDGT